MKATAVNAVRMALAEWAADNFHPTEKDSELRIDAEVLLSEVNLRAVQELDRLGPFGHHNSLPRFVASNVELVEPPKTMGEGGRHLQLKLRQHSTKMRAVAFGRSEWVEPLLEVSGPISVSFAPKINEYRGYRSVEMELHDWKPAQPRQAVG